MEKILGQALKNEREIRGVSLADIASETHIGTRFLQALEDEEFDLFPGNFYIHYYIKSYLQACGADETAFFNTYQPHLQLFLNKSDELSPEQFMQKMAYIKFKRRKTILLALLLLAGLGILAYLFLGPPRLVEKILAGKEAANMVIPAFSNYLLYPEADSCPVEPPLAALFSFEAPCWLQLWRGSEKVIERTFSKGEIFSLHGYQLTLVIAHPQSLRLILNGRDVAYFRKSPTAIKLVVNPGNLQEIYQR
jgi:hypothetical protein